MPGRKRVRTTVRTYFAYSIFDRTCHGSVEAFGNGNQAKLIHPIMLLLPHQVADKNPTQHAPFHVIGIFLTESLREKRWKSFIPSMAVPIAPTVIREAGRIRLFGLNLYSTTDIRDVLSRTPASDRERFRGNSCKGGSPTAPIAVNIVNWNNASRIQIKDFTKYLIDFRPQRNKNLLTLQLSICYFLTAK